MSSILFQSTPALSAFLPTQEPGQNIIIDEKNFLRITGMCKKETDLSIQMMMLYNEKTTTVHKLLTGELINIIVMYAQQV